MTIQNNAKLYALREAITEAIKEGNLEKKMDVFKLQAVEVGLEEQGLNTLVEELKNQTNKQNNVRQIVSKKKRLLSIICFVCVIAEWVIGLLINFSWTTIIWLLVANVLTVLLIVFCVAYLINRKIS